jgi:hypothetical protein
MVRGVKRAMAGEYSRREFSAKVSNGQSRLIELGSGRTVRRDTDGVFAPYSRDARRHRMFN